MQLYRWHIGEFWKRELGTLSPRKFSHRIGGCEDLIKRLKLYAELDGHEGCVNTVHFNPSGDILVSGSDDMNIIFWNWDAKSERLRFPSGHENNVFQARIMPFSDDRSVVTCGADGQVRHAQVSEAGNTRTSRLAKHSGRAHRLAIEPGSPRTFFSCGEDGVVRHFDLREETSTKLLTCYGFNNGSKSRRSLGIHLNAIVINPRNPNYFAVGGSDEYARVYDIRKVADETPPVDLFAPSHLIGTRQVHITCIAYSQQEEILISYNDELIYLFDKGSGLGSNPGDRAESDREEDSSSSTVDTNDEIKVAQVFQGHRNAETVKGVNFFGPNTEYVVSGSDCGHVFIWKKKGGEVVSLIKGDKQVVNCLEPHPSATILATSGIDKTIKIWTPSAMEIQSLPEDAEKIMEKNKQRREDMNHISLTPDVIMHLLRLQRRQTEYPRSSRGGTRDGGDHDNNINVVDDEEDDDSQDDDEFMAGESEEDDDEGGHRECIIS